MRMEETTSWVVYRMATVSKQGGHNAVCTLAEWEAKELAAPGVNILIRGDITNEGEAERLARDLQSPPPPPPRASRRFVASAQPAPPAVEGV